MESSPGKYHALSFTNLPYNDMVQFMKESKGDKNHIRTTCLYGFTTIRINPKYIDGKPFIIRLVKAIDIVPLVKKGYEDYRYYDMEREITYLKAIASPNSDMHKIIRDVYHAENIKVEGLEEVKDNE